MAQVAHLGRWKSNAILAYAEEALEELPANLNTWVHALDDKGAQVVVEKPLGAEDLDKWKSRLKKEIQEFKESILHREKEKVNKMEEWTVFGKGNPTTLPPRVQSLPSKLVH